MRGGLEGGQNRVISQLRLSTPQGGHDRALMVAPIEESVRLPLRNLVQSSCMFLSLSFVFVGRSRQSGAAARGQQWLSAGAVPLPLTRSSSPS